MSLYFIEYICPKSGRCLDRREVFDGVSDCSLHGVIDTSDEDEPLSSCIESLEFSCSGNNANNALRCIPRSYVKDGKVDCHFENASLHAIDEEEPLSECFNMTEFRCVENGRCIPRYRVMDGYPDCKNGSDEESSIECHESLEIRCNDNGRCIPRFWRGNNINNCPDGSDEIPLRPVEQCQSNEFLCHNSKRCIPLSYLCDGIDQCGDCSDEIESCLPESQLMFRCPNDPNNKCIYLEYSCDAYMDCPNGTDDITSIVGFKCYKNLPEKERYCVIPQRSLWDNFALCDDQSDICYRNGTFVCSKCEDKKTIISPRQWCDGIVDCPDLSDECFCGKDMKAAKNSKLLCNNVCYGTDSVACENCDSGNVFCPDDNMCIDRSRICDGRPDCALSVFDERYCGNELYNSGRVESIHNSQKYYQFIKMSFIFLTLLVAGN